MKIYVHLSGELKTSYKTLYIEWFQYLLQYMSKYNISDCKSANDSDIIIVTIHSYITNYHNNSTYSMKKYILVDTQDSCATNGIKLCNDENILYLIKPHVLNPISLNNKLLTRGRYHLTNLNKLYKKVSPDSTDIKETDYGNLLDKIKCLIPHWYRYRELFNKVIKPLNKRSIDVCFLGTTSYHNMKNLTGNKLTGNKLNQELAGSLITQHRLECINAVNKLNYTTKTSKHRIKYKDYISIVNDTKILVSPYGWGEFSHKDFQVTLLGCILIKPNSNNILSYPNIYEDGVTCISCKLDYSDLEEKVNYLLSNPKIMDEINNNVRKRIELFNNADYHIKNFYDLLQSHINDN